MTLSRPRRIDAGARDRTALYLSILAATLFLPVGVHLPYFPVWLSARGLSDAQIATVLAAPIALRVIATPLIATIADKRGIAIVLAACALAILIGYCGLGFARGYAPIFAGVIFVAMAMGAMPSLADALTLAEIRRVEMAGSGRIAYGHVRVWTSIGVLAMMLLSGRIVGLFPGERIIFALAGLAILPALVAILAAATLKKAQFFHAQQDSPTADRTRLLLAIVAIGAAALIQASHAEVYSFATLHWRKAGLSPDFISAAWAIGVASEALVMIIAARFFGAEKNAISFLVVGAAGAVLRWLAMSSDPDPWRLIVLQAGHGLSFGATTCGSVLLLGSLAAATHRTRMQGWLAAATALSLAAATFACGRLTDSYGEKAYLAMAALAGAGLALALVAGRIKLRLHAPS
ncbi:MFS transporter [Methylocapsa polymorpha]|uniref:MFS transporter n=1 Tax=Methylocapsa polymorpha TaxID=3080828 RepID=A0ABZ0HQR4_9HYPH|nr:MFS transporter [Methylocapsa sp. RX1]